METATAAKSGTKDVYGIINDRILELLEKGVVPWRVNWHKAGPPTNLISKLPYRGINAMLLAMAGYTLNYFLTEKQLETIGGTVNEGEKPHVVAFWNNKDANGGKEKKQGTLGSYKVYNVAQCSGIFTEQIPPFVTTEDNAEYGEHIISKMPHRPEIRHKEALPYYDPLLDFVNVPKKSNKDKANYYAVLFHQLVHSTGHHTRLDRMGLVQMREVSYTHCSLEELVTEIAAGQLCSLTGITGTFEDSWPSATEWYEELVKNKYLIFTACTLSLKALDYILDSKGETESVPDGDE